MIQIGDKIVEVKDLVKSDNKVEINRYELTKHKESNIYFNKYEDDWLYLDTSEDFKAVFEDTGNIIERKNIIDLYTYGITEQSDFNNTVIEIENNIVKSIKFLGNFEFDLKIIYEYDFVNMSTDLVKIEGVNREEYNMFNINSVEELNNLKEKYKGIFVSDKFNKYNETFFKDNDLIIMYRYYKDNECDGCSYNLWNVYKEDKELHIVLNKKYVQCRCTWRR